MSLHLDWCSYEAAKYAVEHWHYSHVMPYGKLLKIGAWEHGDWFIGSVVYAWGANKDIGSPYGLDMTQVCELVRVALRPHQALTSQIVARSIKMIKKQSSGLRLVVSYADTEQDHIGTIYQATNWVYVGTVDTTPSHFVNGRWMKQRMASATLGSVKGTIRKPGYPKIKYLYPLDEAMRKQIEPLKKPYPKRETCGRGETDSAPQSNEETGGTSPTSPLLVSEADIQPETV